MAVGTNNTIDGPFVPNGTTTDFPFTFTALDVAEVSVVSVSSSGTETAVNSSLYSVALNQDAGGVVVFSTAPSGDSFYISLAPSFTEAPDFEEGETYVAAAHNSGFNRGVLRDQVLRDRIGRSFQVPLGESGTTLPSLGERAGKFLTFDATGNAAMSEGGGADSALRTDLANANGSRLVNYQQSSSGAATRNIEEKLRERVTLTDFFQSGDADYTSAFTRIAALPGDAIEVIVPSGEYTVSSRVSFTDKHLLLRGAGGAARILDASADGFLRWVDNATAVNDLKKLVVKDLTIEKTIVSVAGAGGTGIDAEWFCTVNHFRPCAVFDNVEVVGPQGQWFAKGIRLVDARNVFFTNVTLENEDGHGTCQSPAGLEIVRDKAPNIFGFYFNGWRAGRVNTGILVSQRDATAGAGTVEGFYGTVGETVNVAYGIREDNDTGVSAFFDTVSLEGWHINSSRAAFKAGRVRGFRRTNCQWFFQAFGEVSTPAPLEAGINILSQLDGISGAGNVLTRTDTAGLNDDAPAYLLPDEASLNWAILDGDQAANWRNLAEVQSGGSLTTSRAKLLIGDANTLINTPLLANYGFRGNKVSIGGNGVEATGASIEFGHTFTEAPAVVVSYRGPSSPIRAWPDAITATGFTLRHDGVGDQSFSWVAVGL